MRKLELKKYIDEVLIVAKCIVNVFNVYWLSAIIYGINSSKVYCKSYKRGKN